MSFVYPEYFWLLLLVVAVFSYKNFRELSVIVFGYMLTFLFIVVALARPVLEQEPIKQDQILSDVIIAIDLSYSMSAKDIKPSRLEKAQEILKKLVKSDVHTRYGVIGFTTNAIVLSPLTQDSELLLHLYDALDLNMVMTKGSSIMPALELAGKMSHSKNPSVVILSDGADELSYEAEALFAKEKGLVVNTFILATQLGGTLKSANGELLKDEIGDIVVSRANDELNLIAKASGGAVVSDYEELLQVLRDQKNKDHKTKTTVIQNFELYFVFVILAIITFLFTITTLKRYIVSFLLFIGVSLQASNATEFFSKGESYYKQGEYEAALESFQKVKSSNAALKSVVFYNIGNSLIRLKEFKKAREAFVKSLTLQYSQEAYENMLYIENAEEQMHMNTGQQKTDKKSSLAKQKENTQQKKTSAGSSNMKVSAPASSGEDDSGQKVKNDPVLNLNKGKAKLSSKQYELINTREVNEKKPW